MKLDLVKLKSALESFQYAEAYKMILPAKLFDKQHVELLNVRIKLGLQFSNFSGVLDDCEILRKIGVNENQLIQYELLALFALSRFQECKKKLKKIENNKGFHNLYLKMKAKIDFSLGSYNDVIDSCDDLLSKSFDQEVVYLKVNALIASGRYDEAVLFIEKLPNNQRECTFLNRILSSVKNLLDVQAKLRGKSRNKYSLAIITPLGPGHEEAISRCKSSIDKACENLNDTSFVSVEHIVIDDTKAHYGRSKARNLAIEQAIDRKFDWVFFLDADDLLDANLLNVVSPFLQEYDFIWGGIYSGFSENEVSYRLNQIPCFEEMSTYLFNPPFLTLQMGHFAKVSLLESRGLRFDEKLDAGEDVSFYIDEMKSGKFIKLPFPFFYNIRGNHSKGERSATGAQWNENVASIVSSELQELNYSSHVVCGEIAADFVITNPKDLIKQSFINHCFFEQRELCEIAEHLPVSPKILEVGANVGNHAIFYLKKLSCNELALIEPNPNALKILKKNLEINNVSESAYKLFEYGAGREPGKFSACEKIDNLGATHLQAEESGEITVVTIDSLMPDLGFLPDFVKIDVEGMELDVLEGASKLILACKPIIYIEVSNANKASFFSWLKKNGYQTVLEHKGVHASNYLVKSS